MRKLQLGAGESILPGWLNTDRRPASAQVVFLDVTERFPLDDQVFDYVCSEHMIEHLPWDKGLFMLKECRRVLKPGGTLRIATPDLAVLLGLYSQGGNGLNERYIKWITETYLPGIAVYRASFAINNAFRNWGHQFLYDGELLTMAMQQCGFTNIRRCSRGESNDPNLRGVESRRRIAHENDMIDFETLVLEGDCPT